MTDSILIKDAIVDGQVQNIYVEGSRIVSIGNEEYSASCILNAEGMYALPALINGHTHAAMNILRGFGDDMPLHKWLQEKIWPAEEKLTSEDIYWGSKLACLEMIKRGVGFFNDQYWMMKELASAADEMGLRALLSECFIDLNREDMASDAKKRTRSFVSYIRNMDSSLIQPAVGPHSIYTVSKDSLRWCSEYAQKEDLLMHFHLSETEKEIKDCVNEHDLRPVQYLDSIDFLSSNVIAAHCVWLSENEIQILSENNVKAVHCPVSNMKLAVNNVLEYNLFKKHGLQVCLGTDGASSNNNLDLLEEMKFASLQQKLWYDDATRLPAEECFSLATEKAASCMNLNSGSLEEGKLADIMLVDPKKVELNPCYDLYSNLVYSASGSCVDSLIIDGEILMQDSYVPGEEEIISRVNDLVER